MSHPPRHDTADARAPLQLDAGALSQYAGATINGDRHLQHGDARTFLEDRRHDVRTEQPVAIARPS